MSHLSSVLPYLDFQSPIQVAPTVGRYHVHGRHIWAIAHCGDRDYATIASSSIAEARDWARAQGKLYKILDWVRPNTDD